MASFMTLPMKLRAMIIEHALNAPRDLPPRPSRENRVVFRSIHRKKYLGQKRIFEERPEYRDVPNILPLLLTSRQVSAEATAVLEWMRSCSRLAYTLDVSVLNDQYLFPTWITVPALCNRIETLHVGVRLFGRNLARWETRQRSKTGASDFPYSMYKLLEHFLIYGPVSSQRRRCPSTAFRQDRQVVLKTAVFERAVVAAGEYHLRALRERAPVHLSPTCANDGGGGG